MDAYRLPKSDSNSEQVLTDGINELTSNFCDMKRVSHNGLDWIVCGDNSSGKHYGILVCNGCCDYFLNDLSGVNLSTATQNERQPRKGSHFTAQGNSAPPKRQALEISHSPNDKSFTSESANSELKNNKSFGESISGGFKNTVQAFNEPKFVDTTKLHHNLMRNNLTLCFTNAQPNTISSTTENSNNFCFIPPVSVINDTTNDHPFYMNQFQTISLSKSEPTNTTSDNLDHRAPRPSSSSYSDVKMQKIYLHLSNIFNLSNNLEVTNGEILSSSRNDTTDGAT
ncbi:unnamed protein product [Schistosoma mattheei]|uniref:Uncharacterized protein n=1 Tax=Schistosoma mattheei TaxID=31246 RepID=A0A183Q3P7_9TREM|nr:unnamed protein product [Schistosoma mattheei]